MCPLSGARLGDEADLGQTVEMPVAGEKIGAMGEGRGIDDGVRRRQLVPGA